MAKINPHDEFDEALQALIRSPAAAPQMADAVLAVCDTAYVVNKWLKANTNDHTATDVLVMTRLALEREAMLRERQASGRSLELEGG